MWSNWAVIFVRGCCTSWKAQIGKAPGVRVGPISPYKQLRIGSFQTDGGLKQGCAHPKGVVVPEGEEAKPPLVLFLIHLTAWELTRFRQMGEWAFKAGWKQVPRRVCPSSGRRSASRRGSGGASSSPPSSPSSSESSLSFLFVFFKLLYAKRFVSFLVPITCLDSL